jgi:hypothetical protein
MILRVFAGKIGKWFSDDEVNGRISAAGMRRKEILAIKDATTGAECGDQ